MPRDILASYLRKVVEHLQSRELEAEQLYLEQRSGNLDYEGTRILAVDHHHERMASGRSRIHFD